MLFASHLWPGLADGTVTVAFRRWRRPTVKESGTLVTPVGVLAIDEGTVIEADDVSDTLRLIATRPATVSTDLAAQLRVERLPFKQRVRRLKALGLTESLDVGYRLSPRGHAVLRHVDDAAGRRVD